MVLRPDTLLALFSCMGFVMRFVMRFFAVQLLSA